MRIKLTKRTPRDIPFGFIYGTIALALLAAARTLPIGHLLPSCVFKAVSGIPCPTCGTTRLLTMLAHNDMAGAFAMNPAVTFGITGAIAFLLHDAAFLPAGSRLTLTLSHRESLWFRVGALFALLANWFYLIASH